LLKALDTILGQTQNRYLKSILAEVISRIKDGKSFSEALGNYPDVFSNLYISMIKAGEIGGNLEETLSRLEDFSQKEQELKSTIKGALAYPAFIAVVGALTISILIGFVIPRLIVMFQDMGEILPLPTRILIATAGFLKGYWWFILSIVFIIVFICIRRFKNPEGRIAIDRLKLKLPLAGVIIQKIEISRFARTLGTLISSGIDIIPALEIAGGVINNVIMKQEIRRFQEEIHQGGSFTTSIKNSKFFPVFVTNIVSVGEEAGTLERSLLQVADEYSKEIERTLKTLTRLVEPAMILLMGLIVGFIVISMLLPIFQIDLLAR
jgi:type II secretory pathway component PulF